MRSFSLLVGIVYMFVTAHLPACADNISPRRNVHTVFHPIDGASDHVTRAFLTILIAYNLVIDEADAASGLYTASGQYHDTDMHITGMIRPVNSVRSIIGVSITYNHIPVNDMAVSRRFLQAVEHQLFLDQHTIYSER